ncbi:hypothetical protein, partial [Nocardia cyriacigeorgica]
DVIWPQLLELLRGVGADRFAALTRALSVFLGHHRHGLTELAGDLRMLAVLAPQVERQAAKAGDMDATTATEMRKKANL